MLEPDKKNIEILWKRNFETDLNSVQELNYIRTIIQISGKNFIGVIRSETPPGKHCRGNLMTQNKAEQRMGPLTGEDCPAEGET